MKWICVWGHKSDFADADEKMLEKNDELKKIDASIDVSIDASIF